MVMLAHQPPVGLRRHLRAQQRMRRHSSSATQKSTIQRLSPLRQQRDPAGSAGVLARWAGRAPGTASACRPASVLAQSPGSWVHHSTWAVSTRTPGPSGSHEPHRREQIGRPGVETRQRARESARPPR